MTGLDIGLGLPRTSSANGWFAGQAYLAENLAGGGSHRPAMIADFRRNRFAMTAVPAGSIGSASLTDLTTLQSATFADLFSFVRPATATFVASGGTLSAAAVDTPRWDWSSGAGQLLLEGAGTNHLRNSAMLGATAGTPGSLPTNWVMTNGNGLTRTIVGSGSSDGIDYVDIRYAGTLSDALGVQVGFDMSAQIATGNSDTWTISFYLASNDGSLAGFTNICASLAERTSAGGYLSQIQGDDLRAQLTAGLKRFSYTATLSGNPTTAMIQARLSLSAATGTAVDLTLRIGTPQLEKTSAASSVIRTAGAAASRVADSCRLSASIEAILRRSAATIFLRGRGLSGSQGRLVGSTSANRLIGLNAAQTRIGTGNASFLEINPVTSPLASFGIAVGWDASGKAGAYNDNPAVSGVTALDATLDEVFLGRDNSGNVASGWYDEMIVYPFRLSPADLRRMAVAAS